MADLFSSNYQRGFEMLFFLVIFVCISLFIVIIAKVIKVIKTDAKLQQKKKEKEIELLQTQIDSMKEGKGTWKVLFLLVKKWKKLN